MTHIPSHALIYIYLFIYSLFKAPCVSSTDNAFSWIIRVYCTDDLFWQWFLFHLMLGLTEFILNADILKCIPTQSTINEKKDEHLHIVRNMTSCSSLALSPFVYAISLMIVAVNPSLLFSDVGFDLQAGEK